MWFYMAQKTDLGVIIIMGFFNDGEFNGADADVLKGHLEGQKFTFQAQIV